MDPITNQNRHHQHPDAIQFCLNAQQTRKLFLKLRDNIQVLANKKGTLTYLQKCKENNIIPNTLRVQQSHLSNLAPNLSKKWSAIEQKTSKQLLGLAILDAKEKLSIAQQENEVKTQELLNLLPVEVAMDLKDDLKEIMDQAIKTKLTNQSKKIQFHLGKNKHPKYSNKQQTGNSNVKSKPKNRRFLPKPEYLAKKKQQQKKSHVVLFKNFSSYNFDDNTQSLIQKGATFCPNNLKVNTTIIKAAINSFERKCFWRVHFHTKKEASEFIRAVVYEPKANLPQLPPPQPVKDAITGIRQEILSSPLNHVHDNLTKDERKAMANLVELRKKGLIVIQPLDKTGGLAIFDRQDYVDGMQKVLKEKYISSQGEAMDFYETVSQNTLKIALQRIKEVVKEGEENKVLQKTEAMAMIPDEAKPGRLYGLAKDHKEYERIPPFRPIVSGSGSLTENISKYVDHHAKPLVSDLPSFIEDTPDLLRALEELKTEDLPPNAIPVTIDVVGLYSNIPQEEAEQAVKEALLTRPTSQEEVVPTDFLIALLHLVLTLNIFTFDGALFRQLWGIAMGTRCAPTVANLFMGKLERKILISQYIDKIYKKFWRRFIDDILMIWTGTEEKLKEFIAFINTLHPTIKFTASYNFGEAKANFLDTTITIKDGKISTDLYRKPTHSPQYLLPSSCHPPHCVKNIPFSLAYRLRRICSEDDAFEKRLTELKDMLLERNYKLNIIEPAFQRARLISREEAIKRVTYNRTTNKITFVIPFDPRLPKISQITRKHFELMKKDSLCAEIFKDGVQVAYKRPQNIRDILCRATLPPLRARSANRAEKGWKTCFNCKTCDLSHNLTEFTVAATGEKIQIHQKITCRDKNVIYCIQCVKCKMQYVGKTTGPFKIRANQHRRAVELALIDRKNGKQGKDTNMSPVAQHFSQGNHSEADMFFFAFEHVISSDPLVIGTRERFYIDKMQVVHKGINNNRTN